MATNNAVNIKSSGIVSYDGSGTFSALANPLIVSHGGSGLSSDTAYAVLCGGTTSTGNIQSIASVGSSGQALTSNGAGALPTFQNAPTANKNLVINVRTQTNSNLGDAATYFLVTGVQAANRTSESVFTRCYIPTSGTITTVYGGAKVLGTLGSGENSTLAIRLNDTTDTTITSTLALTSASNSFSNTGLSISVNAGDFIDFKLTTATWATNPTLVTFSITALII